MVDDRVIPANISLKTSYIEYIDRFVKVNNNYKSRSEYISSLVVREIEYGKFDRFIELFGTIFYPLVIFVLFFGFTFATTGMISYLFFFLSCFAGLIVIVMFFLSFFRYGTVRKRNAN